MSFFWFASKVKTSFVSRSTRGRFSSRRRTIWVYPLAESLIKNYDRKSTIVPTLFYYYYYYYYECYYYCLILHTRCRSLILFNNNNFIIVTTRFIFHVCIPF